MRAADYVAGFLHSQHVEQVFEVSGGMIVPLLDAIHGRRTTRLVSMHHEQAAAFAAQGVSLISRVPGVAMATSGPGALNLLTGIASCYFDSTPAVFITGQVNRAEQRGDRSIRQLGFQETDIVSIATPVVKAAWQVRESADLPRVLADAFTTARSDRPGPVLVDLPIDLQGEEVRASLPGGPLQLPPAGDQAGPVDEVIAAMGHARRPLILAGGGVCRAGAARELAALAERLAIPVVSSLLAVDVLPAGHPLRVGMIGTYGNRWANIALAGADCLLVLGSRLDIRQTGADVVAFKADRPIFHVDIDPGEINNRVTDCVALEMDVRTFIDSATRSLSGRPSHDRRAWLAEIDEQRSRWPDTEELRDIVGINPNRLMHRLSAVSGHAAAFVTDVGQHQMWAAQSLDLTAGQRFITSGGIGAMGSGLPLAIGAAIAVPGKPVVLVAGDAGFQLNLQELQTIAREQLPIKIVVLDNECHGMVRQFQDSYFEGRYPGTWWGYSAPDFARVGRAFEIASAAVQAEQELDDALAQLWRSPQSPFLLEIAIDPRANAYPKIAFGRPITEMEPLAEPAGLGERIDSS